MYRQYRHRSTPSMFWNSRMTCGQAKKQQGGGLTGTAQKDSEGLRRKDYM